MPGGHRTVLMISPLYSLASVRTMLQGRETGIVTELSRTSMARMCWGDAGCQACRRRPPRLLLVFVAMLGSMSG